MIHRLHEHDAPEMLARGIPRSDPLVVYDVGAHTGAFAARLLEVFDHATVYAFEPAPGPFKELQRRARADARIVPVPAAVGDRDGQIRLRETANPLLASVLCPSDRSAEVSSGASRVVDEREVELVTLDAWADRTGTPPPAVLKLDIQGFELPALRGARGTLRQTRAVYAEAHLEQAYEGASTFSEIDLYLRDAGFHLHQIHEITTQGDDLQTVQLDALWLVPDLLERIRTDPLESVTPPWASAFIGALDRCRRLGIGTAVLYGAGTHTRSITPWLDANPDVRIPAIIDDRASLRGEELAGRPIIGPERLGEFGRGAVILSSDTFEDELWRKTAPLRRDGIPVFRLYGREAD